MPRRKTSPDAPYQSITGASRLTGLAQGFIREGCKTGTIPHIMCGGEYRICMPLFLQSLAAESAAKSAEEKISSGEKTDAEIAVAEEKPTA